MFGLSTFSPGTEGVFHHLAAGEVAQLGADKGSALARLHMLKLHDLVRRAVHLDLETAFEIRG